MTAYNVVWTEQAYESLRKLHDFIAVDAPEGAKKVVRALAKHSQSLEKMPRRFPCEPALENAPVEYRFVLKWNYKIIYTILESDKTVLVVLVFDTRQNPLKLSKLDIN